MYETVCTFFQPHRDIKTGDTETERKREMVEQECNLPAGHSECRFTVKLLLAVCLSAGLHLFIIDYSIVLLYLCSQF